MYFVIVGVPQQVGSKLEKRLLKAKEGHQFSVLSYAKTPPRPSQGVSALSRRVLEEIEKNFEMYQGFAVLNFCSALHPNLTTSFNLSIPCCDMGDIGLESGSKSSQVNRSVSEALTAIDQKLGTIINNHKLLKTELAKTNSTPFLLPWENFDNSYLRSVLDFIAESYSDTKLKNQLSIHKGKIMNCAKMNCAKRPGDGRNVFVSDEGLVFKTPGRAKHGSHPPDFMSSGDHKISCRTGALLRFGIKIQTGFHYDCTYENQRRFSQNRQSCHAQTVPTSGCSYINIYPNDYVRPTKKK